MKLSNFTEIVEQKLESFDQLVDEHAKYLAHIDGVREAETLQEHINLVMNYAKRIVEEQSLDIVIDNLIKPLTDNTKVAEEIKLMFVASIAYHDLGKINPEFQVHKMHNDFFPKTGLSIGSQHSILSANIFLFYFVKRISNSNELDAAARNLLLTLSYLFTFPILKHHSSFLDKETAFSKEVTEELFQFLKNCKVDLPIEVVRNFTQIKDKLFANIPEKSSFSLFALLKLSYSILTASDYYATNEFMAGIKVNDFGILSPETKAKVITNFQNNKEYNRELFKNFELYHKQSFSQVQERNENNLNLLRQKLTAEVISTLRENPNGHWYYIEAPTGAGKTNLSLACVSELLKADSSLNKVFYVFPFTTLITQTMEGIKDTIGLNEDELIQLHSKAGFHESARHSDGEYGKEKRIYLDNLFVNYPFCVTSHVHFFDVLKGNSKDSNYLMHRLCNSIVVIDELQSYNPLHWDKILYFIENYTRYFNMRFIIMSATLPRIDALSDTARGKFINLTPNKKYYFSNPNFAGRVDFDFSLLKNPRPHVEHKQDYLAQLSDFIFEQAEAYFQKYGHVKVLTEFITKNTASIFFRLLKENDKFADYTLYILSGDILEPQRKKVIRALKTGNQLKLILVSTQVVEAGVDIDMDLGFKDRSLLDSDEQLAGRINRNASKNGCKVFLFDCDRTSTIYGNDKRYKEQQRDKELYDGFEEILKKKDFDQLYRKVFESVKKQDPTDSTKLNSYLTNLIRLDFQSINNEFKLIEDNGSVSVFIPVDCDIPDGYSIEKLRDWGLLSSENKLSGQKIFDKYLSIIKNENQDFTEKKIDLKKITGLMSQFTISVYPGVLEKIKDKLDVEKESSGFVYLSHFQNCYNLEEGFNFEKEVENLFL